MPKYSTKALDASTWADFARLVEANNGVWGGCWCTWYHDADAQGAGRAAVNRETKERLVRQGNAHACLVFDGDVCVGWCQFGSPKEIPRIHNARAYHAIDPQPPDWRITCFFAGKGHRGKGVAYEALKGALAQIKKLGGGLVEGYPEDLEGRKTSPAFLFNGALVTFERLGFERSRLIGKHKWVVTRKISV